MRVELVCPAAEDSANMRSLALATLAALTPEDVEISLCDDMVRKINPETDIDGRADIAAFTVSTKTALRAYELAAAYRERGAKVVMGGIHPTAVPEEALEHADAVVVGEHHPSPAERPDFRGDVLRVTQPRLAAEEGRHRAELARERAAARRLDRLDGHVSALRENRAPGPRRRAVVG